jgi:hypothetical protein
VSGSRLLLLGLKLAIMGLSIWFLAGMVDWGEFGRALLATSPWTFLLVVAINLGASVVMTWRWHLLARAAGCALDFRTATAYTFLGFFFNQILPGSVGGDAARIWCLRGEGGWGRAVGTVLWDRLLGLAALVVVTLTVLPFQFRPVMDPAGARAAWLLFLLLLLLFLAAQHPRVIGLAEGLVVRLLNRLGREGLAGRLAGVFGSLRLYLGRWRVSGAALLLSLVIRLVWIGGAFLLSRSMDLGVGYGYLLFAVCMVELVRMIPVSIQGLGVRELAFVFFLDPVGVSPARGTLLSLLFFTALNVSGLVGGLVYLWLRPSREHRARASA